MSEMRLSKAILEDSTDPEAARCLINSMTETNMLNPLAASKVRSGCMLPARPHMSLTVKVVSGTGTHVTRKSPHDCLYHACCACSGGSFPTSAAAFPRWAAGRAVAAAVVCSGIGFPAEVTSFPPDLISCVADVIDGAADIIALGAGDVNGPLLTVAGRPGASSGDCRRTGGELCRSLITLACSKLKQVSTTHIDALRMMPAMQTGPTWWPRTCTV